MSDEDVLRAAWVAASRFAARGRSDRMGWGRGDRRDWLGTAWERIERSRRRGVLSSFSGAVFVGVAACVDRLRAESRWDRIRGVRRDAGRVSIGSHDDDDRSDSLHPAAAEDGEARVYRLWGETRPDRSGLELRTRVMLYLWAVERWTKRDVAESFGLSESSVSSVMNSVVPPYLRHPEKDADQDAWVRNRNQSRKRKLKREGA